VIHRLFAGLTLALAFGYVTQPPSGPDIVILNARVYTGDAAHPWAEAISIRANRIDAVGTTAEVKAASANAARTIDAGGRLLIPGFNDAHAHPGAMPDATILEGPPAVEHDPPLDEMIARIKVAMEKTPSGRWIVGQIGSAVLEDPRATRETLDPLTTDRPLMLHAWTGHGTIFNTPALRALRVSDTEADPPGGLFGRLADGRTLSGLAHEYADYDLRRRLTMIPDQAAQVKAFEAFATEAASFGITSVQAMMTAYPAAEAAPWIESAHLPVRMRLIDFPTGARKEGMEPASRRVRTTSPIVTNSGTMWILDGTPIERLALLRAP
jgi:predicted amidohydrolase YtcJ